jgi:hypothetical protein
MSIAGTHHGISHVTSQPHYARGQTHYLDPFLFNLFRVTVDSIHLVRVVVRVNYLEYMFLRCCVKKNLSTM